MANYPAVQIANTFINKYSAFGIGHLKLQKLVYYSYGWWLAFHNDSALANVRPQVWKLGPVFQPVYGAFAGFRNGNITAMQPDSPFVQAKELPDDANEAKQLIDWIWKRYGNFSGVQLSNMTHEPGTPWYEIAKRHNFVIPRYTEMDDVENRAYFVGLAEKEGLLQ